MVVLAAVLLAFIGWLTATRANAPTRDDFIGEILLAIGLGALAIWLVTAALRTRVILSEHGIESRGAFLSRSVGVADILGHRRVPNQPKGIQFDLRAGRGRRLRIRSELKRDEWFESWLARIPDLDAAERATSLARVLEDRTLGATPDDVAVRLKRVVLLGRIGGLLAIVLLLELQFAPAWWTTQLDIAIAFALGLAALLSPVLLRGLVTLEPTRNDARPSPLPMLALPMFVLPSRVAMQFNLQDGRWLVIVATALACAGLLFALPLASSASGSVLARLGARAFIIGFLGIAIAWLNVGLDRQRVPPVRVAVTARSVGKGPVWRIGVTQADGAPPEHGLFVSRADYSVLQVGDVACLSEHRGLFGLGWAELHPCAEAASHGAAS
jgi:hypothetical protein